MFQSTKIPRSYRTTSLSLLYYNHLRFIIYSSTHKILQYHHIEYVNRLVCKDEGINESNSWSYTETPIFKYLCIEAYETLPSFYNLLCVRIFGVFSRLGSLWSHCRSPSWPILNNYEPIILISTTISRKMLLMMTHADSLAISASSSKPLVSLQSAHTSPLSRHFSGIQGQTQATRHPKTSTELAMPFLVAG